MLGIILVTHGEMAEGIMDAAKIIYGQPEDMQEIPIEIVELKEGESPETLISALEDRIEKMKAKGIKGALIISDLFGSSTTNAGTRLMLANKKDKEVASIAVVSGLNLPMLLELIPASKRSNSAEELASLAVEVGRRGITSVADELAKRRKKQYRLGNERDSRSKEASSNG
jgi:mannose/fructose-specific phosphotransferase system component IIA